MIYKSEEEMKEKLQSEMLDAQNNLKRDRIKLFFKRIITIIIVFSILIGLILLRNHYGEVEIKSSSLTFFGIEFEKPYSPLYRIELGDDVIKYDYINDKKYTLIPYFVNFHNIDSTNENKTNTIKYSNNLSLNISASLCKSKNSKGKYVDACYYSEPIYESINTSFENIKISNNNSVIYSGIFNSNLNDYIKNKGNYSIEVISVYNNVKTTLIFNLEVI